MPTIPNFPQDLMDEHHAWHDPRAHPGLPTRRILPPDPGSGLEFLVFHRDFMQRVLQWYDVQPFANQAQVAPWTSVPTALKTPALGWNGRWASDENRLTMESPPFASDDELGLFIELGIHNEFLHPATATAFGDPLVGTLHSPGSTFFYQIHGLVQYWWGLGSSEPRLEIFAPGSDLHLWHLRQSSPNGDWSNWDDLTGRRPLGVGVAGEPAVGGAADGRLEIFVRGNDGHLWHLYQTSRDRDWSDWEDLSVYRPLGVSVAGESAVGSAADGRLEIFVRGSDGHLWHLYQAAPNGDWSDWEDLSVYRPLGVSVAGQPAVGSAADGRLEVFVRGSDGHLWHLYQTAPNGDWSIWEDLSAYRPLGVSVAGEPALGNAADGRLEIFVRGSDGHLWHLYQTSPNGDWSDWEDLSVHRPLGVRIAGEPAVARAGRPSVRRSSRSLGRVAFDLRDHTAGAQPRPEPVARLRQSDVRISRGRTITSTAPVSAMRAAVHWAAGQESSELRAAHERQIEELEKENTRLRRAVSDLTLDKMILADARETH